MNVDVFISYARVDREVADRIAASLHEADVAVWWDALLLPGETFDERIQTVVAEAKVFVGILSPTSLLSDWVRWELSQAIANGLHVIPVLVDGVVPEDLPPTLSLVDSIVLSDLDPARLRASAERVRMVVEALRRRTIHRGDQDRDARRRLAQAATETAMRAGDIKQKNRRAKSKQSQRGREHGWSASPGLPALLGSLDVSLAITSPDAGKLYLVGCDLRGDLSVTEADFDGPTGVRASHGPLVVAARTALHTMVDVLHPEQLYDGRFSRCFVARKSHFIGELAPHDVALSADGPLFVSSRYSCVATVSSTHSFRMVWRPRFVTKIVPEDRCHLNGLAVEDGELAFATAFGEADSIDGWRGDVAGGGVVLDTRSGEVVCRGLTMPHSPRVHDGRLWLLNSGAGELGLVRTASSGAAAFEPAASLPGFSRGLAFADEFAFAGVSRPRYESFRGLEVGDRLDRNDEQPRTGVAVIDTRSGERVEWFWLEDQAREVYDVAVLPGGGCAMAFPSDSTEAWGLITMDDTIEQHTS